MMKLSPAALGSLTILAMLSITAQAQSVTPMRGTVTSFTDEFAMRIFPTNPYSQRIPIEIHVYDQDFYEIDARISPSKFILPAGGSRKVTVVIPFDGLTERRVRICTESVPFPRQSFSIPQQQTTIRTQICGRFIGQRR